MVPTPKLSLKKLSRSGSAHLSAGSAHSTESRKSQNQVTPSELIPDGKKTEEETTLPSNDPVSSSHSSTRVLAVSAMKTAHNDQNVEKNGMSELNKPRPSIQSLDRESLSSYPRKSSQHSASLSTPDDYPHESGIFSHTTNSIRANRVLVRTQGNQYYVESITYGGLTVNSCQITLRPNSFLRVPMVSIPRGPKELKPGEEVLVKLPEKEYFVMGIVVNVFSTNAIVQTCTKELIVVTYTHIVKGLNTEAALLPELSIAADNSKLKLTKTLVSVGVFEVLLAGTMLLLRRTADFSMKDDATLFLIQTISAFLTLLITIYCLLLSARLQHSFAVSVQMLTTLKAIQLSFSDLISISYPSITRLVIMIISIATRAIFLVVLLRHPASTALWKRMRGEITDATRVQETRRKRPDALYRRTSISWKYFCIYAIAFFTFIFGFLAWELYRAISNQNPLLGRDDLQWMRNVAKSNGLTNGTGVGAGIGSRSTSRNQKVFMVLLDGMRYDYLERNAAMKSLLSESWFKDNSVVLPMRVQTPTMSTPNWLTLITGTPTHVHGVIGNAGVSLTLFDSIFSLAHHHNKTAGLTGSSWFGDLVQNFLSLSTESTNDANFDYDSLLPDSTVADMQRYIAVNDAVRQKYEDYDFYLAHFSDIDEKGHRHGVTTKFNKADSYNKAITEKVDVLRDIAKNIDEKTTLILVSDHGHIDSGGHGGLGEILDTTFFIAYQKDSGLGNKAFADELEDGTTRVPAHSVDIAPSICSLLGMPLPMTSFGKLRPELLSLLSESDANEERDKWALQQQILQHGFNERVVKAPKFPIYSKSSTPSDDQIKNALTAEVDSLDVLFNWALVMFQAPNIVVMGVFACIIVCMSWITIGRVTALLPSNPFRHTCRGELCTKFKCEFWTNVHATKNGILIATSYMILSFGTFQLYWTIMGKPYWDSTLIHHPVVIVQNFAILIIPGIIYQFMIDRAVEYLSFDQRGCRGVNDAWKTRVLNVSRFLLFRIPPRSSTNKLVELNNTLMLKTHLSVFGILVFGLSLSLVGCASFSGLIKFLKSVYPLDGFSWQFRFRIMSLMWICLPLLISSICGVVKHVRRLMWLHVVPKDLEA